MNNRNNRLLFRAKRLDDETNWVHGYLSFSDEITVDRDSDCGKSLRFVMSKVFEVDAGTVGQCTGLKDKCDKFNIRGRYITNRRQI